MLVTGTPDEVIGNTVTIYKPAREATQQGMGNTKKWILKFDETEKKWYNPLMGWTSGKQTSKQIELSFLTEEEAIAYAERQGLQYNVRKPETRKKFVKSYASNFKYKPNPQA